MVDIYGKDKRSDIMSRVRSSGNKATEIKMIKIFKELGIKGWRRKIPISGKPDFTFQKLKIVVFVDGCFWHGCPIHGKIPKTNGSFWKRKLERNVERDKEVTEELINKGWFVIRVWQHELKQIENLKLKLSQLISA
ncbi:very short patch repair endonuclease [uncultured Desulfosarcina sp.]|uniref:very short patch repair endonuclease n=1 Tax=uncultured Desulfosarcina sp. TaxID=218289 RepID=UPI0029C8474D|nr:very short patch repair endonuclease [uncultured Desulfosarcina sp.]